MSADYKWVTELLAKAKASHPKVTDSVSTRMKDLLEGGLSDQPLSKKELETTAKDLITRMSQRATETEAKQ